MRVRTAQHLSSFYGTIIKEFFAQQTTDNAENIAKAAGNDAAYSVHIPLPPICDFYNSEVDNVNRLLLIKADYPVRVVADHLISGEMQELFLCRAALLPTPIPGSVPPHGWQRPDFPWFGST